MNRLLKRSTCRFTQEQLESLWGWADDSMIQKVAERNRITISPNPLKELQELLGGRPAPRQGLSTVGKFLLLKLLERDERDRRLRREEERRKKDRGFW